MKTIRENNKIILIIIFFIFGIMGMSFSCGGIATKQLSGGYIYCIASGDAHYIEKEKSAFSSYSISIPCKIIDYDFDENFIIAAQTSSGICTNENNSDFYQNKSIIGFWIISNSTEDHIYGPMDLNEYLKTRKELGVPDNLKLKLYL